MTRKRLYSFFMLILMISTVLIPAVEATTDIYEPLTGLDSPNKYYGVYLKPDGTLKADSIRIPIISTEWETGIIGGIMLYNVTLDQGELINEAKLSLWFEGDTDTSTEDLFITVYGAKSAFSSGTTLEGLERSHPVTTAYSNVNLINVTSAQWVNVTVTNIVQEIVNLYGWSSGNSLAFLIYGTPKDTARSFQSNIGTKYPYLSVTHGETPSGSGTYIQQYRNYTIWEAPVYDYEATRYYVTNTSTWRMTNNINQHWTAITDQDIIVMAYKASTDALSYYITRQGDLSDWDSPEDHTYTIMGSAISEEMSGASWIQSPQNDTLIFSGGYYTGGNYYQRLIQRQIDATTGLSGAGLFTRTIGSHGGNVQYATSVTVSPTGYIAMNYGSGTTSQFKTFTSLSDATAFNWGSKIGVNLGSGSTVATTYLGDNKQWAVNMGWENEGADSNLRFRLMNMQDETSMTSTQYLSYIENQPDWILSPGGLTDPNAYLMYYNYSSAAFECRTIYQNGTTSREIIDEYTAVSNIGVTATLQDLINETRIMMYYYDQGVNDIIGYSFYNGTWENDPITIYENSETVKSLHATPLGTSNASGIAMEWQNGIYYFETKGNFVDNPAAGGGNDYNVYDSNGSLVTSPCLSLATTIEEVQACINSIEGGPSQDDPNPPGSEWSLNPWFSRGRVKLYFFTGGLAMIFLPLYAFIGMVGYDKIKFIWIIALCWIIGVGLLLSIPTF